MAVSPLIVGGLLILGTLPWIARLSQGEVDRKIANLLLLGLLLKIGCVWLRIWLPMYYYGSLADAGDYLNSANALAAHWRAGEFDLAPLVDVSASGSRNMDVIAGFVSYLVGPSLYSQSVVFSWLGFCGGVFFFRAFRIAFPAARPTTYLGLVIFAPSMLFWSSTISKEAVMCLCLGLSALGAAALLHERRHAYAYLGVGTVGEMLIRPHVGAMLLLAVYAAFFLRRVEVRRTGHGVRTVLTWALLLAAGVVTYRVLGAFFHLAGDWSIDSIDNVHSTVSKDTGDGAGQAWTIGGALRGTPIALVTVLLRPFPPEARSPLMLLSALEGSILAWVLFRMRIHRSGLLTRIRHEPFLIFASLYVVMFCASFSAIDNLGLLVRERIQVLPFALAIACAFASAARTGVETVSPDSLPVRRRPNAASVTV
jgi:hypothetical protein